MATEEQERVERINRKTRLDRKPDDPHAVKPRATVPLIAIVLGAFAVAAVVVVVMFTRNTQYDGAAPVPAAQLDRTTSAPDEAAAKK